MTGIIIGMILILVSVLLANYATTDDQKHSRAGVLVVCIMIAFIFGGITMTRIRIPVLKGKSYNIETTITTVNKNGVIESDTLYTIRVE